MTDEEERSAIKAAMHRLLAAKPLRSSGNLDVVTLADEAGLKRNELTHKHKHLSDLNDPFYAEVTARDGIPASEIKLHEEIAPLKAKAESLRQERDSYRATSETFARAAHVLTVENDNLRKDLDKRRPSAVTALPSQR